MKLFEEWLAEALKVDMPEKWKNACPGCKVLWIDDFDKARDIMFRYDDDTKMYYSTFSKIFGRDSDGNKTDDVSNFGKDTEFCYVMKDGHIAAALYCGKKKGIPFIYELASMREEKDGKEVPIYPGAGSRVVAEFGKKYGMHFWLQCASDEAKKFWQHVAKETNSYAKFIKKTSWGQPVYVFNPDLK